MVEIRIENRETILCVASRLCYYEFLSRSCVSLFVKSQSIYQTGLDSLITKLTGGGNGFAVAGLPRGLCCFCWAINCAILIFCSSSSGKNLLGGGGGKSNSSLVSTAGTLFGGNIVVAICGGTSLNPWV